MYNSFSAQLIPPTSIYANGTVISISFQLPQQFCDFICKAAQ